VHPTVVTDIGPTQRKWRIQFQAPPAVAKYLFQFYLKSDSYVGTDLVQDVELVVEDASKLEEKVVEEVIPEVSGEMLPVLCAKWLISDDENEDEEDESDEESDDESDEDTDTSTDSDTDSD